MEFLLTYLGLGVLTVAAIAIECLYSGDGLRIKVRDLPMLFVAVLMWPIFLCVTLHIFWEKTTIRAKIKSFFKSIGDFKLVDIDSSKDKE